MDESTFDVPRYTMVTQAKLRPNGLRRRITRALSIFAPLFLYACVGCGPVWYIDPEFGERQAAQTGKPLLLYFKVWDSSQHRNMRLEVFDNGAVKSELTGTVNVEVEFGLFPEFCKRFGVQRPQVCVMATPQGKRVGTPIYVNPVPAPEQFLEWLKRAKAEAKPSESTSAPATPQK